MSSIRRVATEMGLPFALQARARLGEVLFAYLLGRARDVDDDDDDTADANAAALSRLRLVPRVMRGCSQIDIRRKLGDRLFAGPLAVGAFAGDRLFHDDGLLPVARACQRLGLPLFVSEETVVPLAQLTDVHDGCWLQIRACGPLDRARRMVAHAVDCGACGVILTVLAPAHPAPGAQPGGFDVGQELARRGWRTIGSDAPGIAALPAFPQWSWTDIATVAAELAGTGLLILAKGILHPEDAAAAQAAGCHGVMVGNVGLRHCGRWLLPAQVVPDIRDRASGTVMLDGGVRHGVDAVMACCLGADFAVTTRPVVAALAAGGEQAVLELLGGWLDEITSVTAWLGVSRVGELDRTFVHGVSPG